MRFRDWSSDVCSSDLNELTFDLVDIGPIVAVLEQFEDLGLLGTVTVAGIGDGDIQRDLAVAQRFEDRIGEIGKTEPTAHEPLGEAEALGDVLGGFLLASVEVLEALEGGWEGKRLELR